MRFNGVGLLTGFSDLRDKGRRETAIFSPVGDAGQFRQFVSHVKKLGLDGKADFIFIIRPGLRLPKSGLSELRCFEKLPLGTSGCFFAGQLLAYNLGYETIVVADLDAFLDSAHTFDAMVRLSRQTGHAVVPLSKSPEEEKPSGKYFVMNQWGAFPRSVFAQAGFSIPYTVNGGEDWELSQRLQKAGLLRVFKKGFAVHPKKGMGPFAKLSGGAKYFRYLSGLLKAYGFAGSYSCRFLLHYLAWRVFYSFFADLSGQPQLQRVLAGKPLPVAAGSAEMPFAIRDSGRPPSGAWRVPLSLLLLLLSGKCAYGSEEVSLRVSRPRFAFFLARACLLLPLGAAQALGGLLGLMSEVRASAFPITDRNAGLAAGEYAKYVRRWAR